MIEFFLRRPIFASVLSLIILLVGLVAIPTLPIAQFPIIAPPTITVTATYTGASAEAVEASVTTPLEQAINGVQGLRYIQSVSANNGTMTIRLSSMRDPPRVRANTTLSLSQCHPPRSLRSLAQ